MKLKIFNGRHRFRQWDVNQKLICEGIEPGTQIHFASSGSEKALVVESYELNGKTVADVPNILLQVAMQLYVYVYIRESDEQYTIHRVIFGVDERPKPDDYVYTETEVLNYSNLERRITSLEDNLEEEVKEAVQKVIDEGDFDIEGGVGTEELENAKTECKEYTDTKVAEVEDVAKGANKAISFFHYADLVSTLLKAEQGKYTVGQNLYINKTEVPDLWLYGEDIEHAEFNYDGDDDSFVQQLQSQGMIHIGYYWVAMLETQKVDLTNYVEFNVFDQAISSLDALCKSVQNDIGNISNELDEILALQNEKINGGSAV